MSLLVSFLGAVVLLAIVDLIRRGSARDGAGPKLSKAGACKTATGAKGALKRMGFGSLSEALDNGRALGWHEGAAGAGCCSRRSERGLAGSVSRAYVPAGDE